MAHNWNRTGVIVTGLGVLVAAVVGGIPLWDRLFPSDRADAEIETIQWQIDEGRLGKGPYAIVKAQVSNSGSTVVNVTEILTRFALGSIDGNAPGIDCETSDFTWMGVPWDSLLRGSDYVDAISIQVPPRDLVTEVVVFEPASVLSEQDREAHADYSIYACLEVVVIDGDLDRQETRIPMGWLMFDDDRILDFRRSDDGRNRVVIFD